MAEAAAHPDAVLLAACAAHLAAEARWKEIDAVGNEALDRYVAPPVPAALLYRGDGDVWIIGNPQHLDSIKVDGGWRRHYASEQDVTGLRQSLARWRQNGAPQRRIDRAAEVLAALDDYVPVVQRAKDAAGVTAFDEMTAKNTDLIAVLLREIATTPATTIEGVTAKARSTCAEMGDGGLEWLATSRLPQLIAGEPDATCFDARSLALSMSLVVDAARLGLPPLPASEAA